MKDEFLRRFIEGEKYLQNKPMETDNFIRFCEERGIITNKKELEFFEKEGLLFPIIRIRRPIGEWEWIEFERDGDTFSRPAEYGLNDGEKEVKKYNRFYYSSYGFDENFEETLLNWFESDILYDPSKKPFQKWSSFEGEQLMLSKQEVVSCYSSFQIYWLDILKRSYSININLAGEKMEVSTQGPDFFHRFIIKECFDAENLDEIVIKLNDKNSDTTLFKSYFNYEKSKSALDASYKYFDLIFEFMLSIQSVYTPYGRSSAKSITYTSDNPLKPEKWVEVQKNFDPRKELETLDLDIKLVVYWYQLFSTKAMKLLGGGRDSWIQLVKNIKWSKKDRLEGDIRLGIEYLGWALMIKRFIEDYLGREILDIDDSDTVIIDSILDFDPSNLRWRRTRYFDVNDNKDYYDDMYKRLFYYSNYFGLDYQPRVMVLVEGYTEEHVLPKVFEWGSYKPDNHGIEFVNFGGVSKLLSTYKDAEDLKKMINNIEKDLKTKILSNNKRSKLNRIINNLKSMDVIVSNWTSFISYNLEKWQIIPFFISDDEGNAKNFLEAEKPIKFNKSHYDVPESWKFIWGIDNDNKPLKGGNFELANFTNEEIATAINKILGITIDLSTIEDLRHKNKGINKLDDRICGDIKIRIADTLVDILLKKYDDDKDESILNRPIFNVIERIIELAALNHPPIDRRIELENKKTIEKLLKTGHSARPSTGAALSGA